MFGCVRNLKVVRAHMCWWCRTNFSPELTVQAVHVSRSRKSFVCSFFCAVYRWQSVTASPFVVIIVCSSARGVSDDGPYSGCGCRDLLAVVERNAPSRADVQRASVPGSDEQGFSILDAMLSQFTRSGHSSQPPGLP